MKQKGVTRIEHIIGASVAYPKKPGRQQPQAQRDREGQNEAPTRSCLTQAIDSLVQGFHFGTEAEILSSRFQFRKRESSLSFVSGTEIVMNAACSFRVRKVFKMWEADV